VEHAVPIKSILFIIYIITLIYFGLIKNSPNKLGWFMFVRCSYCYADLKTKNGDAINIWKYLPHSQVVIHESMIRLLIEYLRDSKQLIDIQGEITIKTDKRVKKIKVRNSYVSDW